MAFFSNRHAGCDSDHKVFLSTIKIKGSFFFFWRHKGPHLTIAISVTHVERCRAVDRCWSAGRLFRKVRKGYVLDKVRQMQTLQDEGSGVIGIATVGVS